MKVIHSKRPGEADHKLLAFWAADCAERVLPCFEKDYPKDDRPRKALEAGRAWARGDLSVSKARNAALAAHHAARAADHPAARAAARAAGHTAATAHVASHSRAAAAYAVTAAIASVVSAKAAATKTAECEWQERHLPKQLPPTIAFPTGGIRAFADKRVQVAR